jgi:signal transduction histidine kinase
LFLIRYLIESLGGKIDVQSKIDSGSTFYVKFLEKAYKDPLIQL